jgi:hypothetical protein
MKLLMTLKTLPLAGLLAVGLAVIPSVSMADKGGDRGHQARTSHDGGKSFKGDKRGHNDRDQRFGLNTKGHDKRGFYRGDRHEVGNAHGHDRRDYGHDRGHAHNYSYPVYNHTTTVVHDYGHRHYLGLGDLSLLLGIHTDNVDIIFRD